MAKIKIDDATNEQLDYAVAVAQGWREFFIDDFVLDDKSNVAWTESICPGRLRYSLASYKPTTDQAQCGELIDEFMIGLQSTKLGDWFTDFSGYMEGESRLILACKAFLYSKCPDGIIEVQGDN